MRKIEIQDYSHNLLRYPSRIFVLNSEMNLMLEYDLNYKLKSELLIDPTVYSIRRFDSYSILMKGGVHIKLYSIYNFHTNEITNLNVDYVVSTRIGSDYILAFQYYNKGYLLVDANYNIVRHIKVGGMKENTSSKTHPILPIELEWYRRLDPTDFKDFFIRAYDLLTDNLIWKTGIDGRVILKIFIDNYIIFSTRSNESMPSEQTRSLYCIKVETGEIQWFKYNFHVYDLLNESSDTVIVHSHDTTYRIDVYTGHVILSKENTTDVLSSIRPFFVDDEGVLFVGRSNNMVDNRFGRLNKNTFDIDWMYYYEIEGNKNLSLKDMILLADGRYLMRNGLKGEEKLFIFDPDDPENIPYRGISNGEVTGYSNLN